VYLRSGRNNCDGNYQKCLYQSGAVFAGLPETIGNDEVDPIQQIITPGEENLLHLRADARRIGAHRIFDYLNKKRKKGRFIEVTDFYGCDWRLDPEKDLYFNQATYPLRDYEILSESLHKLNRVDWHEYVPLLRRHLDEQIKRVGDFCCIADRNTQDLQRTASGSGDMRTGSWIR